MKPWQGGLIGAFIGFLIGAIGVVAFVLTGGLDVAPKGWGALAVLITMVAIIISTAIGAIAAEEAG